MAATSTPATTATETETALVTPRGRTTIADTVVEKIAGIAAREVRGVYKLGGGASRAFGAVRERIPGARPSHGAGVSVEVGEQQAAVDLDVVVEYGAEIGAVSQEIRRSVIDTIESMTTLEVTEVNIAVGDIHIPGDDSDDSDDDAATPARVRWAPLSTPPTSGRR